MVVLAMVAWGLCRVVRAEVVALQELEKRALERHLRVQEGAARVRAAAAQVREAEGAYQPQVGLNMESAAVPGLTPVPLPDPDDPDAGPRYYVQGAPTIKEGARAWKPRWRNSFDLTVGANLFDFGRTRAAVAASRAKREATEAERELTRAEVVGAVRGAYLSWLSAHELQRLSANANTDARRRSERVTALVQEGARARGDLAPVEADRLLSELELERAVGELASARLVVAQAVGDPLPPSAEPDLHVLDVEAPPAVAETADPSLRILAFQRDALEATARMQRMQRAPVLSGLLTTGVRSIGAFNEQRWFPTYSVGLSLAMPLWDGGALRAAAEATEARSDELRLQLESGERARQSELERARLDAQHAHKRGEMAQQLLDVCRQRVADVEAGYDLGAMQFDQVQQARAMLRRAETELVLARVARAEAVLRVAPP